MVQVIARETLAKDKPMRSMAGIKDIQEHVKVIRKGNQTVAEFVSTGDFASAFTQRQRYEVEAGRDMEPILYTGFYDEVVDGNLPQTLTIYTLNPTGLVLEERKEGEEVKFTAVGSGSKAVTQSHYAVGLEYTEEMFIYTGNLWQIPRLERSFGQGLNALMNHIHFNPFLSATYATANKTDGTAAAVTKRFRVDEPIEIKYMRTLEAAMATARSLNMHGPFGLLTSTSDVYTAQRALNPVQQRSSDRQGNAFNQITNLTAYDGWSGTRGKKATTYSGVTAGKGYLVSLARKMDDFLSLVKQPFRRQSGDGDLSRFILEQVMWDTRLGVYANVADTVIEITWPDASHGTS